MPASYTMSPRCDGAALHYASGPAQPQLWAFIYIQRYAVAYSLGVDIGSTYTAASIWRDGSVQSVPLGNRANAVPSVLFLRDDDGLLAEPVAAAAWYAVQSRVAPGALIGVYDLGGGTFDASVVRKTDTGFEVVGEPGGDDTIGGLNFDHLLLRYVAAAAGLDLGTLDDTDPAVASALAQFQGSVVDAKEALSTDVEAVVPVLFPGLSGHVTISRTHLESLVRPQIQATVGLFAQILARAGVEPGQLHAVLLIGGSSRIPLVAQLLRTDLGGQVDLDA